jgi:hypothetical protein
MADTTASSLTTVLNAWLIKSADLTNANARRFCSGSYLDRQSCAWYHGVWQYLRLMDLVSSPSWHHDFYTSSLKSIATASRESHILISGTADYSMYAYVLDAIAASKETSEVVIIDMCETPLLACTWLGEQTGQRPLTRKEDIRYLALVQPAYFDCICSDAFLTRFEGNEVDAVLAAWAKLLKPGGSVITTVRIYQTERPDRPAKDAIAAFVHRAETGWEQYENRLAPTTREITQKTEVYARRMTSNSLGTKDAVLEKVSQYFQIIHSETVDVRGELYPSSYLRLVLKKYNEKLQE